MWALAVHVSSLKEVWEETNISLFTKGKGWICCLRPCARVSFCFLWANERNRKAERESGRETPRINTGIKWQQTDHAGAEVSLNLPSAEVSFFFPVLALSFPSFFSIHPPPPPLSPEISFQHAKPCKNRPRVFKLRPVCKDVPACSAASGYCRSGPLASLCPHCVRCFRGVQSWVMRWPAWWERAEEVGSRCRRVRWITFSGLRSIF